MGIGNVVIGLVDNVLVLGTYTLVCRFRLFIIDMRQWWAEVLLLLANNCSCYRIGGPTVSPHQSQQSLFLDVARGASFVAEA